MQKFLQFIRILKPKIYGGHSFIKNKINVPCKKVGSASFFVITLITCKSQQLFQVEAFVYAVCL